MAKKRAYLEEEKELKPIRPAIGEEARENQMIGLAVDCAEKQMREGTASAQVICHYLKLGSMKERYEIEKLKAETALKQAQIDSLASQQHIEELYANAMKAFATYSGNGDAYEDL